MSLLIRGGTVVNADMSQRADVLCEGGTIRAVGAVPRAVQQIEHRVASRAVLVGGRRVDVHAPECAEGGGCAIFSVREFNDSVNGIIARMQRRQNNSL